MNALLEPILKNPELPNLIEELQAFWEEEQKRRQQFYNDITPDDKAEFINGEVVMHSPTNRVHNVILRRLLILGELFNERQGLKGEFGVEKLMIRLTRNDFEPDLCYWKAEKASAFTNEQMLFPAPDFIVEVLSKSTAKRDRGIKMDDYGRHGVQEYWLVDPEAEIVEQYVLERNEFQLRTKASNGSVQSSVLNGFSLNIRALFDDAIFQQALNKI